MNTSSLLFETESANGQVNLRSEILTSFAKSQPHAAYSAITKGLQSNWSYITRTTPNISHLLQPLEDMIRRKLIPELTGRSPPNDTERSLLALPARHGGIAITNPVETSDDTFSTSTSAKISNPLRQAIVEGESEYSYNLIVSQNSAKAEVKKTTGENRMQRQWKV